MTFEQPMIRTLVEIELHLALAPHGASEGARVYRLLPALDTLLDRPGFARRDPICLPGGRRPFNPWALWAAHRRATATH